MQQHSHASSYFCFCSDGGGGDLIFNCILVYGSAPHPMKWREIHSRSLFIYLQIWIANWKLDSFFFSYSLASRWRSCPMQWSHRFRAKQECRLTKRVLQTLPEPYNPHVTIRPPNLHTKVTVKWGESDHGRVELLSESGAGGRECAGRRRDRRAWMVAVKVGTVHTPEFACLL